MKKEIFVKQQGDCMVKDIYTLIETCKLMKRMEKEIVLPYSYSDIFSNGHRYEVSLKVVYKNYGYSVEYVTARVNKENGSIEMSSIGNGCFPSELLAEAIIKQLLAERKTYIKKEKYWLYHDKSDIKESKSMIIINSGTNEKRLRKENYTYREC